MCLENTWYSSLFLTMGTYFCIVAGVCAALWITVLITDWAFNKMRIMHLVCDFSINRKAFKEWEKSNHDSV